MSRTDRVSAALGPALMRGDTMLAESCFDCGTVLMRTRNTNIEYCVLCMLEASEAENANSETKEPSYSRDVQVSPTPEVERVRNELVSPDTTEYEIKQSSVVCEDPAEILRKRRAKRDGISDLIGEKMLQGYAMSGSYCDKCTTVLLCDKEKNMCCFGCAYDMAKRPPGKAVPEVTPHATTTTDNKTRNATTHTNTSADTSPNAQSHAITHVDNTSPTQIKEVAKIEAEDTSERAAQLIGEALLAGNVMLHKACDTCGTVLLRDSSRVEFCVLCKGDGDATSREEKTQVVAVEANEESRVQRAAEPSPVSAPSVRSFSPANTADASLQNVTATLLRRIGEYTTALNNPKLGLEDTRDIAKTMGCMLKTLERAYSAQTSATKYARLV